MFKCRVSQAFIYLISIVACALKGEGHLPIDSVLFYFPVTINRDTATSPPGAAIFKKKTPHGNPETEIRCSPGSRRRRVLPVASQISSVERRIPAGNCRLTQSVAGLGEIFVPANASGSSPAPEISDTFHKMTSPLPVPVAILPPSGDQAADQTTPPSVLPKVESGSPV